MSSTATTPSLIGQARQIVADLFTPHPVIFWADFLVSLVIGYGATILYLAAPMFSAQQIACFLIAGVALFRAALFMHEIVHLRRGEMTAFRVAWNVLAGIPMLIPSFLYESHLTHHKTHHYGTVNDGEYLPLGVARLKTILAFLAQIAFLPLFVAGRFLMLTPISFLHPRLRTWVLERASSFVINFSYRRAIPDNAPRAAWAALELGCFLRMLALFSFVLVGEAKLGESSFDLGWHRLPKLYLLAVLVLGLNQLRTLVAHRYRSTGEKLNFAEQFDDSINVAGQTPLAEFLFPVGLRYHALHHMFPSIPYHNLGIAHRRLIAELPTNSAYHHATYRSFWAALRDLIKSSRQACAEPPPGEDLWFARRRQEARPVLPTLAELEEEFADESEESESMA
jgi:fatty acid desaturase